MSKKISGAEYPLAKIFSSDFDYVIPSYQRPYAWTEVQASELFSDLHDFFLKEKDDTYFLGSIVLIKDEGKPHAEVIDGQQRLTTLTIFLAVLAAHSEGKIKDALTAYMCEPGNDLEGLASKPRLALRDRDRDFFRQHVQELRLDKLFTLDRAQLANESQQNIQAVSRLLSERVENAFKGNADEIRKFASFLVQRCFLVAVSTPSQQSAFRVFSVLNSRGLDLLPTDIIKSDVIGGIKSPQKQDDFTEKWEELEVEAGRDGFAELFGHIRMIYAKSKAKRALLEEFREHVLANRSPEDVMTEIVEPYAEAYLIAKNSEYTSTSNAADINALLKWLNRIENSDWLPAAILFLAQKKNDPEYVFFFLKKLERLAAYMHICGKYVNDRIDRFAIVLRDLEGPHSLSSPPPSLDLTEDEKQQLRGTIGGKVYDDLPARRRNYLVLRLDSFMSDGAASYDTSILTIEHVLPQTVDAASQWATIWPDAAVRAEWVHRLANLVPLASKTNSAARNYDFDVKKTAYFGGKRGVSSYVLTTQVLHTPMWTPEVVQARQTKLMETLSKSWDLAAAERPAGAPASP